MYLDFRQLQLIEYSSEITNLFIKFSPYFTLCLFQILRKFLLKTNNFFAAHSTSNEGHYHNDVAEPEGYPGNEK